MDTNGKAPKRPRDMNQLAKLVGELATGEAEEVTPEPTDEAARKRGEARAAKLTAEERSAIAKKSCGRAME